MSTAAIAVLGTSQAIVLETSDVAALRSGQIVALGTSNVAALGTSQVAAISTGTIAVLGTSQVAALTTSQVVALASAQVAALSTAAIVALGTSQAIVLQTSDLLALKTSQIVALGTSNVAALGTSQVAALSTKQVEALTSSQVAALSTSQVASLHLGTPVVLDLNGDGVKTLSISLGTTFDLFATGRKVDTGWVSSSDGLLALDRNHDGKIDDGSELFGSSTTLANGEKAKDGYAALSELDSNHDGAITKADDAWKELKVWVDRNSDGISENDELFTLDSLGISKLNLNAEKAYIKDNGNLVGLTSSYETSDGASHDMADVWFVADKNQDLRTKVSDLTQAIAAFDDSQSGPVGDPANSLTMSSSYSSAESQAVAVSVGGLVDTLKNFDSNGNLIANAGQSSSPLQAAIGGQSLGEAQDPTKTGFLASK
ncbi:hypothetical protein EKO24_007940 [Candidatus Methylobacter oryzae]|uniref:Uncharacterized protein n=1 Tax=Candidatus Methylobacter oryzae TaxID=2497749 RepID=A0ABY3CBS4_9GAMM|nr:hypothetical protein EKO24_007940 [Candidatus Methylobacter oryzae]